MNDPMLVIEKGEGEHRRVMLATFPHILGRMGFADTGFEHQYVSRRHAELTESNGDVFIRDLSSHNGTRVNGTQIGSEPVLLNSHDVIELGRDVVVLRFLREEKTVTQTQGKPDNRHIIIDRASKEAWVDGERISPRLSQKEFDILAVLAEVSDRIVSTQQIAKAGWSERPEGEVSDEEIRQIIQRLRNRTEHPEYIENVRGVGYKLV